MSVSQKSVVILNDFQRYGAVATKRIRTTGAGTSSRVTIDIRSEPVGCITDPKLLGQGVADAIAKRIGMGIKAITAIASGATLAKRKSARDNPSSRWVQKRYSGGRTGLTPPTTSVRLFNDSNRLANGIVARATRDGTFALNVPANRLDESSFGSGFEGMLRRLFQLVDVLRDPLLLGNDATIRTAVVAATKLALAKGKNSLDVAKEIAKSLKNLANLGGQLADENPHRERQEQQTGDDA